MYHGHPEYRADLRRDELSVILRDNDEDKKPPVVVTTYEMIIKDRRHFEKCMWSFIVVDEGHRLKNMNCKLMQEIKKYKSGGRMVLTGTPLHVSCERSFSDFSLTNVFIRITCRNFGHFLILFFPIFSPT